MYHDLEFFLRDIARQSHLQSPAESIGGEDGRRTIELITAIYLSGSFGQTVELPLTKDSPFYTVDGIMKNTPHFYEKAASVAELNGEITVGGNY